MRRGKMPVRHREYARQEGPYAIQIELCEGCNLRCNFCGLQGIRSKEELGKNYKFMEENTLKEIMYGIVVARWNPRIEFAMHGEPTMHPNYIKMIDLARRYAPQLQLMITSNGGGLLRKPGPVANIDELFDAGLNILALDDYVGVGYIPKIRNALKENPIEIPTYEYPADKRGNPHQRHKITDQMLVFLEDVTVTSKGTHSVLTNHAGCGSPALTEPLQQRCAKPFRELSIRWDGNISHCCNDWRGTYKCGNINETTIGKIWNGPAFSAAREVLYAGNRKDIPVCSRCDYKTYRNGLLPDKFGKTKLPDPDEQTMADIAEATEGTPYTEPRITDWEH
jgi:radical SAM protein with 4Fe4S-binding SPASM domain